MRVRTLTLFIFTMILISGYCYGDEPGFRKIINSYLSVKSVKGTITQHIYPGDGTVEVYTGSYFALSGGFIRIDYSRPEKQTVIVNNEGLFWYYPGRRLLFTAGKKDPGAVPVPVMTEIIPAASLGNVKIISEGNRFYSFFKTASVYSIASRNSRVKIILWIDNSAGTVIKKYLIDESGNELLKEDYIEHMTAGGITIPVKIELKAKSVNGIVHTLTVYSDMVINGSIDKDMFRFKITPEMEIRKLRGR